MKPSDKRPVHPSGGGDHGGPIIGDDLIDQVREWLAFRWRKAQIRDGLNKIINDGLDQSDSNFVPISPRTIERIIAAAREAMLENARADAKEHRAKSLALYEQCLQDPKASWHVKMVAQQSLDHLLGHAALTQQQIENLKRAQPEDTDADAQAARIRAALAAMDGTIPKG